MNFEDMAANAAADCCSAVFDQLVHHSIRVRFSCVMFILIFIGIICAPFSCSLRGWILAFFWYINPAAPSWAYLIAEYTNFPPYRKNNDLLTLHHHFKSISLLNTVNVIRGTNEFINEIWIDVYARLIKKSAYKRAHCAKTSKLFVLCNALLRGKHMCALLWKCTSTAPHTEYSVHEFTVIYF